MLTSAREYRAIAAQSGLFDTLEARLALAGQRIETLILKRLADRLRSDECHGMNKDEIAGWIEAMTYGNRAAMTDADRALDLFRAV